MSHEMRHFQIVFNFMIFSTFLLQFFLSLEKLIVENFSFCFDMGFFSRLWVINSLQESYKIIAFKSFIWRSYKIHKLFQRSLKEKVFFKRILWAIWFCPKSVKFNTVLLTSLAGSQNLTWSPVLKGLWTEFLFLQGHRQFCNGWLKS